MRKRLLKISIFLGIFLIIGLFGTFFFIRSQTFLNWVERRLETELKNRITDGYTASIGKIEGNILGSVSVKNVEISKESEPVISTEEVSLIYNPLRLLTRKFEVKKLKIDNPQIHANQNPDGGLNLSNIFQEDPSTENTPQDPSSKRMPQFGFAIELLDFTDGTINYIDTQRNLDITINGISVKVEGPLNTWKHDGTLKIETGSFTFNGSKTAIDNFDAEFSILASRNELKNLYIKFGNSDLTVTGGYTRGKTPFSWDGRVNLELDVADVQQFFSEGINLEGVVKANLRMNGTDSTLDSTLTAEMPTFSIAKNNSQTGEDTILASIALADLNVEANFNSEPTPTFTLKTFHVQVADGTMTSDGSVTLENPLEGNLLKQFQQLVNHPFNYKGKWSGTEVQLIPFLSMFVKLPENLADSTGVLSGTAEFNGNSADLSSLKFDSQIAVMETTLDEIKFEDSVLDCTIADGNLTVDGNLDETEINITGPFPLAQQDILDIRLSGVNFDDLMKLAKSADIGGTAELSAQLSDGILKGSIEIPEATFNDIPIGLLTGDFRYHDGKVFIEKGLLTKNTIEKLSVKEGDDVSSASSLMADNRQLITTETEYESRATITGTVDVEGEFPANFSIVADPVYVQHYPRVLLGAEYPVDGEVRGELKLDGTLINLDGRANFSVTKGVAWGVHLDPLTLPLEIEDYNVTLPNFKITTRGQQVTLNISVAPNSDYDFLLESDAPVRFEEIAKAANISDFPFEGEFDVRVVGVLRKPDVHQFVEHGADFRVELDFSDVTFLNNGRGTKHLLGDVSLLGKLIERKNTTGEPDIFDFHGHGFDGTSQIRGYVSMDTGNPYHFTAENEAFVVKPILSILHPALASVIGTADGSASISGTLQDLAPSPEDKTAASDKKQIYPYDVNVLVTTSQLRYENTADHRIEFTNTEPIRLHLKDDEWTIDALSLRTSEDKSPFIGLTGTFDAKSEAMNLHAVSDEFALPPFGNALGLPLGMLQAGTARYDLKVTGTSLEPIVNLEWAIPALTLETEVGDIDVTDAGGAIIYQEETLRLEDCAFKLLGNDVTLGGHIDVDSEKVNNSELHLRVNTIALDLATLPMEAIDNFGSGNGITGILETSMEIGGTLAEPLALLYAETVGKRPIRFASYIPAITLERLRVDMNFDSEFVRIQKAEANGQMGDGTYLAEGKAVVGFGSPNPYNYFEIDVSASQVEIGSYGVASGYVKLSGTDLDPQRITVISEINKLELDGYDFRLTNSAPLQFRYDPSGITEAAETLAVHIPLQLTSPKMTALMNIDIGGTLDAPNITTGWNGTLNQKEWTGNIQYRNSQIELIGITVKDGTDMLTLTGVIPFNLTFVAMDISERFLAEPINMRLRSSELPLNFFPGIDTFFSEADGTIDIDLALQGTSRDPYIMGNVSLEAPQLHLKSFHEPIQNMKMRLKANDGAIDVTELQFDIGRGYCILQQGRLALDGLTPKDFTLAGLRFELFPLGSTVQHSLPPDLLEEVEGYLSMTLNELTVPLDSFLTSEENMPLQIQEIPSLADLVAVSSADLLIKSVRLSFKALNRHYDFQDPQPIQIFLNDGTVTLSEAFILENEYSFPVKQTFTDEDEEPAEIVGNVRTIEEAKTTLSIDAESKWSVNGEFDGALRFKNFDVLAITEAWPAPYRITGALSGSLQMSGTSENPKITLRRHENEPAELYLYDVPIDLRWRIRYQNGKWEISERRYLKATFGENQLNFSWSMPYQLELIPFFTALQQSAEKVWTEFQQTPMRGILDIAVEDLDMLRFVVPGLRTTTGTSEMHVELTGTMETPEANGGILFKNVGFELPDAGINIENIEGKLQLSEKGASITQFDGMLNGGNFSVKGSMTAPPDRRIWQTPPTLEMQANLTSMVFEQQGQYRVDLDSTEFSLQGELLRPRLTGNLHINGGYYQQNWEIVRDWLTGVSVKETDILLDYPILRDLHLDVDINIPNNFRVLSSITGPTDIEIGCLGELIGPINRPVFSGNVSVLRGKVGFFAQTFEIVEGSTISNQSTVDFNPVLNVHLQTPNRIRGILPRNETTVDLQVFGALTGTLNNPNFTLSASSETTTEVLTDEDITAFLFRNPALSGEFGRFTFSLHRPFEENVRSISAEYPLGKNISIKIETNEKREHGIDVELKGRF
ncbi:MAG: translocation/assembly module TamB domain-containing protein [Candidatus Poribacteria bacterium]|nr:translocation/assembly module TamB domain-containing protein [Candidatus Poribacteria bacterium]